MKYFFVVLHNYGEMRPCIASIDENIPVLKGKMMKLAIAFREKLATNPLYDAWVEAETLHRRADPCICEIRDTRFGVVLLTTASICITVVIAWGTVENNRMPDTFLTALVLFGFFSMAWILRPMREHRQFIRDCSKIKDLSPYRWWSDFQKCTNKKELEDIAHESLKVHIKIFLAEEKKHGRISDEATETRELMKEYHEALLRLSLIKEDWNLYFYEVQKEMDANTRPINK